jgi:hypothetical protein
VSDVTGVVKGVAAAGMYDMFEVEDCGWNVKEVKGLLAG